MSEIQELRDGLKMTTKTELLRAEDRAAFEIFKNLTLDLMFKKLLEEVVKEIGL